MMMSEQVLADELGLPRERLKEVRKNTLARGVEWERDGQTVLYTEAGVKKMRKALGLPAAVEKKETRQDSAGGALEKKTGADTSALAGTQPDASGAAATVDLTIDYMYPNPTWIKARDGKNVRVDVRVRNSARLRPGMILRGCVGPDERGRFTFNGRCW